MEEQRYMRLHAFIILYSTMWWLLASLSAALVRGLVNTPGQSFSILYIFLFYFSEILSNLLYPFYTHSGGGVSVSGPAQCGGGGPGCMCRVSLSHTHCAAEASVPWGWAQLLALKVAAWCTGLSHCPGLAWKPGQIWTSSVATWCMGSQLHSLKSGLSARHHDW